MNSPPVPHWAQPGITAVPVAREFLETLRRRDTLFIYCGDGEAGYPINFLNTRERGHGASVSPNVVTATPPPEELIACHRSLGLGPERVFCPASCRRIPLAKAVLADERLLARLREDRSLRGLFTCFKDPQTERLSRRLGLDCVACAPPAAAYAALNDKFDFARAAARHGFAALSTRMTPDADTLEDAFRSLGGIYGQGCILRLRRGVGGLGLRHAPTLERARRIWRRLRAAGDVLVTPFIPPALVVRNIGLHGIATPEGFAPLVVTDQLIRDFRFRGGRVAHDLTAEEIGAIRACLPGFGSWLRAEGYVNAPAGVDGFLLRAADGPSFVAMDPNIRMTGTMRPWSVVATLSEAAGRSFLWQFERLGFISATLTLRRLHQRLGADMVEPGRLEQGGILPSYIGRFGLGPLGALRLEVILLGRDADHLDHLCRRVRALAIA
jgi:hypothetical protein